MHSHLFTYHPAFAVVIVCLLTGMQSRGELHGQTSETNGRFEHVFEMLFDTLMGQNYSAAEAICDSFQHVSPGNPSAYYAQASVIYSKITDLEDTTGTGRVEELVDSCLAGCEKWRREHPDSLEAERAYLTGAAYSLSGLTRHRTGRTFDGLGRLMASRKHFDRAIDLDPEFYDAYVGRGLYRYAAATNLSALRWLPLVPSKKQGWADLTLGVEKSKFSRFAALSSMVWIVIQEENYTLADSMIKAGLERFPNSRTFLMPKLALEKRMNQWSKARETALELLRQYQAVEDQNGYEEIGLHRTLMDCSDLLGESEAALNYARLGLSVIATPYALERRKDTLKALRARIEREESK